MKKRYIIAAAVLLLLGIVAPGLMGMMMERQFQAAIAESRTQAENGFMAMFDAEFEYEIDRRWFGSTMVFRTTLSSPEQANGLQKISEDAGADKQRLVVTWTAEAAHGPFIWEGFPSLAVARIHTTGMDFASLDAFEAGQEGLASNPLKQLVSALNLTGYTDIGFTGTWSTEARSPASTLEIDGASIDWGGFDLSSAWKPNSKEIVMSMNMGASEIAVPGEAAFAWSPMQVEIDMAWLDDWLYTGTAAISTDEFKIYAQDKLVRLSGIGITSKTEFGDTEDVLDTLFDYRVDGLEAGELKLEDMVMRGRVDNYSRAAHKAYTEIYMGMMNDPAAMQRLDAQMRQKWAEVGRLFLTAQPQLHLEELAYRDADGRSEAEFLLGTAYNGPVSEADIVPILSASDGMLKIAAPQAHAQKYVASFAARQLIQNGQEPTAETVAQLSQAMLAQFVAQGFLRQLEDGSYISEWRLEDGVLLNAGRPVMDLKAMLRMQQQQEPQDWE